MLLAVVVAERAIQRCNEIGRQGQRPQLLKYRLNYTSVNNPYEPLPLDLSLFF